jgi:hypothetical protein
VAQGHPKNGNGWRPPWETDKEGLPIPQEHHINPRSRKGERNHENILSRTPSDVHWAYHRIFGNLQPLEIIATLLRTFFRGGRFRKKYRRIISNGERPPKVNPDGLLLDLIKLFPEGWALTDELIGSLTEQRDKLT